MATITTSIPTYYSGGVVTTSEYIVGYVSSKNHVMRFSFTTGAEGASTFSWRLTGLYFGGGTKIDLRWYIGTSATDHVNAGVGSSYTGTVQKSESGGEYTFSSIGDIDYILLPNTTYYLWIFPNSTTYGYWNPTQTRQATVTVSGAAGIIYIDNGSTFEAYQCYIDNGTSWDLYIPYIDNGSTWEVY